MHWKPLILLAPSTIFARQRCSCVVRLIYLTPNAANSATYELVNFRGTTSKRLVKMDLFCQHRVVLAEIGILRLQVSGDHDPGFGRNRDHRCETSPFSESASKLFSGPGRSLEFLAEVVLSGGWVKSATSCCGRHPGLMATVMVISRDRDLRKLMTSCQLGDMIEIGIKGVLMRSKERRSKSDELKCKALGDGGRQSGDPTAIANHLKHLISPPLSRVKDSRGSTMQVRFNQSERRKNCLQEIWVLCT